MTTVRDLTPADAEALTALYRDYEWWDDRDVEAVRRALTGTDVAVGVVDGDGDGEEDGDLVAAGRVLTDFTYYAIVFDVIVAADRRGEGFGRALMEGIRDHPETQSVVGTSLLCRRGLVPFYESVGFEVSEAEVDVPEGGREELVRMRYERDE